VTERPILFQGEMVRAILDGRKTVTRRTGKTWARVKSGDVLWVRECWCPTAAGTAVPVLYRSDYGEIEPETVLNCGGLDGRWRPSIHMPRWACRLRLRVVSVLLQSSTPFEGAALWMPDVTDDEAQREGFASRTQFMALWRKLHPNYAGPVYRVQFDVTP
jgi:hypothetical protein